MSRILTLKEYIKHINTNIHNNQQVFNDLVMDYIKFLEQPIALDMFMSETPYIKGEWKHTRDGRYTNMNWVKCSISNVCIPLHDVTTIDDMVIVFKGLYTKDFSLYGSSDDTEVNLKNILNRVYPVILIASENIYHDDDTIKIKKGDEIGIESINFSEDIISVVNKTSDTVSKIYYDNCTFDLCDKFKFKKL